MTASQKILNRLPHRMPFLLVDRIVFADAQKVHAMKLVSYNEPCMTGHFPGRPVFPGVLTGEAMAQAAAFIQFDESQRPLSGALAKIDLKLRRAVVPGDTLIIHVELIKKMGRVARFAGKCIVNDVIAADAEFSIISDR